MDRDLESKLAKEFSDIFNWAFFELQPVLFIPKFLTKKPGLGIWKGIPLFHQVNIGRRGDEVNIIDRKRECWANRCAGFSSVLVRSDAMFFLWIFYQARE
jgi:hypothetical protein